MDDNTTNYHNELVAACEAAVAYNDAIELCANDPEKMASFCTAEGDDLDILYFDWQQKSRDILEKIKATLTPEGIAGERQCLV